MAAGWAETRFANEIRCRPRGQLVCLITRRKPRTHQQKRSSKTRAPAKRVRWSAPSKHCSEAPRNDPRAVAAGDALLALGAGLGRLQPVAAGRMRDVIQRDQPVASQASVTGAVVFYCICSGSMLIVNKLAVVHLPVPALLTVCQFTSASTFVYTCKLLGILEMVQQRGAIAPSPAATRAATQPATGPPPGRSGRLSGPERSALAARPPRRGCGRALAPARGSPMPARSHLSRMAPTLPG